MLSEMSSTNGKIVKTRVLDLINLSYGSGSAYIPVIREGKEEIEANGTAIFKDEKYVDTLDSEETRGFLMIMGKLETGPVVLEIEGLGTVTLMLNGVKSDIKIEIQQGKPVYQIALEGTAFINAIDHEITDSLGAEYYQIFEEALAEKMQSQAYAAIEKAAVKNKSDIFSFGRRLLQQQTEYWRTHGETWGNDIAEAKYIVTVQAQITRVGQEITPGLS